MLRHFGRRLVAPQLSLTPHLSSISSYTTDKTTEEFIEPESFVSQTQRDKKLRYFAFHKPDQAVALLERSVYKMPVVFDGLNSQPRFLKVPSSSVCNRVLNSASVSEDVELVLKATRLAQVLDLDMKIDITLETSHRLLTGLAKAEKAAEALDLLKLYLDKQRREMAQTQTEEELDDVPPAVTSILEQLLVAAANADDVPAVLGVLSNMALFGVSPSSHGVLLIANCLQRSGDIETARKVLLWLQKNCMNTDAEADRLYIGGRDGSPLVKGLSCKTVL